MADITMCQGGDCGIKEQCYRYTAKPSEYWQSYFVEPPFKKKMDGTACDHLWYNRRYADEDTSGLRRESSSHEGA